MDVYTDKIQNYLAPFVKYPIKKIAHLAQLIRIRTDKQTHPQTQTDRQTNKQINKQGV